MSDKKEYKGFFELLDSKNALIVGLVGGLLSLGTLGFLILGTLVLQGKVSIGGSKEYNNQVVAQQQTPTQQQPTPQNIPKSNKPKVELFVMSYCPYGLQMEKAVVPAWDLLKNKADFSIKFVNYIMHGKTEIDENNRQYCIQKEEPSKLAAYIKCIYTGKNGAAPDFKDCLTATKINTSKMNSCISSIDREYKITDLYNDQTTWLSGRYPLYKVHDTENNKYGVQGSPTLVINGVQAEVARTPEAVKAAICNSFNNAPSECSQSLSNASFQPGFGLAEAAQGGATDPGCGT